MRYLASVAIGLILLCGAWLVKDGSVFTTDYQPPPDAPATIGTWVNIGPASLSYIDNPADPGNWNGGRVGIAVDPHDPNHWLSGAGNGGVWESDDGGTSWLPITGSGPTLATGAIAFAPSNPQTIYVGTGEAPGGVGFVGAFPLTARRISGAVGPGSYTMTVTSVNSCGTSVAPSPVTVVVP